jgi:Flp pilus assembly protein TadD
MDDSFLTGGVSGSGASRSPIDRELDAVERMRLAGDYANAFVSIDRIASANPNNARALSEYGACLRIAGHPIQAAVELRKARRIDPEDPSILVNLGGCLRDLDEPQNAIKAYRKALDLRPNFVAARAELGETYHGLGDPENASRCYELAHQLDPSSSVLLSNLASARIECGDFEDALKVANRCLDTNSRDRLAMAVKAFALHELQREQEAAELFNLDRLRAFSLESAPDGSNLEEFNQELSVHIQDHPTLQFELALSTTVKGKQTNHLLGDTAGPVDKLMIWVRDCVDEYLRELPRKDDHPYLGHRPQDFQWNVWGTLLGTGGHQAPHIHPAGWVSGVYYAQLPGEVTGQSGGHEGWIQFGGHPETWPITRQRPLLEMEPRVGTLFLFPSYYYHRTLPFESDTNRISIAFDAMPL